MQKTNHKYKDIKEDNNKSKYKVRKLIAGMCGTLGLTPDPIITIASANLQPWETI